MWDWIVGYLSTTVLGVLSLGGSALAMWYNLPTYLPLIGRAVVSGLALLGTFLIGVGQGYSSATQDHQKQDLVAQARAFKDAAARIEQTMMAADAMQQRTSDFVAQVQNDAAVRKGDVDALVQQLSSVPVPPDCRYSPVLRDRLRAIPITRPRPARSNSSAG